MATILKPKDFLDRESLETHIVSTYGSTVDKKDVILKGTTEELSKLFLSHGDSVWGVLVTASDYQDKPETPRVERGADYPSQLNGIPTKRK